MPELPEVETVARLVRPHLVGRTIVGAETHWTRTLGGATPAAFARAVRGATVDRVHSRAKYVVIDLERHGAPAGHLLVHLRMTGRLFVEPTGYRAGPHDRVVLVLHDGRRLVFLDVRKFGRFEFLGDATERLSALGPEPLAAGFTAAWLGNSLRARNRRLKPLLLDQTFLAGLGNIYVDEALHASRLHPETSSRGVSPAKSRALHAAIRDTLTEAIRREGSSFDTFYRTPEGNPGSYQDQFRVYGRDGKPCGTCGATIVRIVVGQRGTHLCPRCQRRRA
jgi:formamidopyrimidine-DNA glycosylase